MAYIVPLHRPSGVRTALKLNLISPEEESLVVAKANRLEIYQITVAGVILRHSETVYGTIALLTKLHPPDSPTDLLFVGTDRYSYFVLSWDSENQRLQTTKSYVDLAHKPARPSQSVDRCTVDPTGRFLLLEMFEGTLTLIPLYTKEKGKTGTEQWTLGEPIPMRITERFIRSLCFLHNRETKVSKQTPKARIAILYDSGSGECRQVVKTLEHFPGVGDSGSADFVAKAETRSAKEDIQYSSSHVIAVEKPVHGSLVLSEATIAYWDDIGEKKIVHNLATPTIWSCWAQVDATRWLLADDFGKLYFLGLVIEDEGFSQGGARSLRLDPLGETSRASVLVYLDAGYFYVGSKSGDSQVIKISQHGTIEVVQTLASLAPVTDFTIMDMGNRSGEGQVNEYSSGQARIVTGSGAFGDGSLRSVRSGVGVESLGSLGTLEHVTDLFPLTTNPASKKHNVLAASFVDETRIFQFNEAGEVEEAETFSGFSLSENTVLACSLPDAKILQVTKQSAQIIDLDAGISNNVYSLAQGSIVAATVSESVLLLSIDGSQLITLDLHNSLKQLNHKNYDDDNRQVSCVHIPHDIPEIAIVGFWNSADIAILRLSNLETISQQSISSGESLVPRSLIIARLFNAKSPNLLIAMADGSVISADFDINDYTISNQKSTILGTQQASLKLLPRDDGLDQVFAACENSSLIYGHEGRLIFSAVTVNDASCVCTFDSEAYPGAMALADSGDLNIVLIDNERTTHVQTLHVGETVRRIAYSTSLRAFGLGCIRRTLINGTESIQSSFKLVEEVMFQKLDSFILESEELIESVMRAQLRNATGQLEERFVVGTAYVEEDTEESVRGRILVFEVSQDRHLVLLAEQKTRSACRALACIEGKIAAALMKTLVIYSFEHNVFSKLATIRAATAPIDLAVHGNILAIGDLMKSLSIVKFKEGEDGEDGTIVEIGRHYSTAWTTAIAGLGENTFLESDAEGNLMVLRPNTQGVTRDDRRRLEVISEFRLGEMVNRIHSIDPYTSASSAVVPKAFLATAEGSLYLFGLIRAEKQDLLMRLQTNMAKSISSLGNLPFEKYRAYHSEIRDADEPFRFVDGELLERFLDCDETLQETVIADLNTNLNDIKSMIENLKRMH